MSYKKIFRFWLPLAFSWLLMTIAGPWIQAVISRLPDAKTNLAAFGIVMSVSVTIETPIMMLLATTTALARDRQAYRVLWRYMFVANVLVTVIAAAFAFTPLFEWWTGILLGIPDKVHDAARPGMVIMLLWSAMIGYRRFFQGILIRNEQTGVIGSGTIIRVVVSAGLAIALGAISGWSGVVIGAIAMVASVGAEALYAVWYAGEAVDKLKATEPEPTMQPLTYRIIFAFHAPLAMTSLLTLLVRPMIERGLASTKNAEDALAAWPVVFSIILIMRAGGMAWQEVVIALSKGPAQTRALRRFTVVMGSSLSGAMVLLAFTPLIDVYIGYLLSVPQDIRPLVVEGARTACLLPVLTTFQNYLRAMLMRTDTTAPIYQAMAVGLIVTGLTIWAGLHLGLSGIATASLGLTVGMVVEMALLWVRYNANKFKLNAIWQSATPAPAAGD